MFLGAFVITFLFGVGVLGSPNPMPSETHAYDTDITISRNCSVAGTTKTTGLILREYRVETAVVNDTSQLIATFSIDNPSSGDTYRLVRMPFSVDTGVWNTCRPGDTPLPPLLARCQYYIERGRGGRIGFRFEWYCDDKDVGQLYVLGLLDLQKGKKKKGSLTFDGNQQTSRWRHRRCQFTRRDLQSSERC